MFDLSLIGRVRIGVLGDAALDVHWYADMKKSELSRETPHYPLPVVREEFSPGAAGNLAANVAALLPGRLDFCGVIGGDWRGECATLPLLPTVLRYAPPPRPRRGGRRREPPSRRRQATRREHMQTPR